MILNTAALFKRGKHILQQDGFISFITRAALFLIRSCFCYNKYYVFENNLKDLNPSSQFLPGLPDFTLKIISTPQEFEYLVSEGFDFHVSLNDFREKLDKGAIVFCGFIRRELVSFSWLSFSNKAKRSIDAFPFTLDETSEAYAGPAMTNPKFRDTGLYTYIHSEMYHFIKKRGRAKVIFSIHKDNITPQNAQARLGSKICAEVKMLKVLIWKSWKEKPIGGSN